MSHLRPSLSSCLSLLVALILAFASGCESGDVTIPGSLVHERAEAGAGLPKIYETTEGVIYLDVGGQNVELIPHRGVLAPSGPYLPDFVESIRTEIMQASLAYRLREKERSAVEIDRTLQDLLLSFDRVSDYASLLKLTAQLCLADGDRVCLRSALELSPSEEVSESILLLDLYTAGSLAVAQERVRELLREHPQAEWIKRVARDLSLGIGNEFLAQYFEEHWNVYTHRRSGMNTLEDGEFSLGDAYRELLFNTINVMRYAFTDWKSELEREWHKQNVFLGKTLGVMTDLRNEAFKSSGRSYAEILARSDAASIPFARGLVDRPMMTELPAIVDFGFKPGIELVQMTWKEVLVVEANLFNVVTLVYGPAAMRAFGKTAAGAWTVNTLRLQRLTSAIARLPKPLDSVVMFLAVETADGCTIRWGYALFKAEEALRE